MAVTPIPTPSEPRLDRVKLVLALSRAKVVKFDSMDWGGWAGAMGDAHMVYFHPDDAADLKTQLAIQHWPDDCTTVILDDGGLTWNCMGPLNLYAHQVVVSLDVECHEPGTPEEIWAVEYSRGDPLMTAIAALPEEARQIVMACPEEARPFVMAGYKAASADPEPMAEITLRVPLRSMAGVPERK